VSPDGGFRGRSRLLLLLAASLLLVAVVPELAGRLRLAMGPPPGADVAAAPIDMRSIDVNRAAPGILETLPGVGPVLAGRIAAERERGGPFADADDLRRVKGIGPATARALEPYLIFSP
jgi:competence protein ComEA